MPDLEFVGGKYDGQHRKVDRWTDRVPVPNAKPVIWSSIGSEPDSIFDTWHTYYRKVPTPARDRHVMRLDGTPWPDRFDTEAWPCRGLPYRQTWTRLHPWVWRGTGVADDIVQGSVPYGLDLDDTWTYVVGVPAAAEFTAVHQHIDRAIVDIGEAEALWHTLAGRETYEDHFVQNLRREADYWALPACPAPGCTGKAEVILTAVTYVRPIWVEQENRFPRKNEPLTAAGYVEPGRELAMCGQHASEERKRSGAYGGYNLAGYHAPWHPQVKSALPDR